MADNDQPNPLADEVNIELAVTDPASFYAEPEEVVADPDLTIKQRRRFLTEWAQDIESRQVGAGEGMSAATSAEPGEDARHLQRIQASLATLPDADEDEDERPPSDAATRRLWRRLARR